MCLMKHDLPTGPAVSAHFLPTLQCNSKAEVGGTVDMVLLEGGFLFVGLHAGAANGLIKVWNTATGAEQSLTGPKARTKANSVLATRVSVIVFLTLMQ